MCNNVVFENIEVSRMPFKINFVVRSAFVKRLLPRLLWYNPILMHLTVHKIAFRLLNETANTSDGRYIVIRKFTQAANFTFN